VKNNKNSPESTDSSQKSRREFIRKSIYASPVLLTLPATPSFAQQGSGGSAGGPGGGDPDPCAPTTPVGGGLTEMCRFTTDPNTGALIGEDVLIGDSEIAGEIASGSAFGTCNSFFCGLS